MAEELEVYEDIFIQYFVSGCMWGMEAEKPVARPLIAKHLVAPELNAWEPVCTFHACHLATAVRAWQGHVRR